jgi:hypothetical protein
MKGLESAWRQWEVTSLMVEIIQKKHPWKWKVFCTKGSTPENPGGQRNGVKKGLEANPRVGGGGGSME